MSAELNGKRHDWAFPVLETTRSCNFYLMSNIFGDLHVVDRQVQ